MTSAGRLSGFERMDASAEDPATHQGTRPEWSAGGRAPTILFFGTYDEALHPRVRVLREGLAAHGARIDVLNRPLGVGTAQRVEMLRRPVLLMSFLISLIRAWSSLVVAAWRQRVSPDIVVVGYLGHFDVHLARLLFRRSTIVLDHLVGMSDTAQDRRLQGRIDPMLRRIDTWALRRADLTVFDTVEQLEHLGVEARDAVVVPVGAPDAFFSVERSDHIGNPIRVLFFGLFTPLQGAETIGEAIKALADDPGISFTIVGDGQDHAAAAASARANPHVHWVDWTPAEHLPALIRDHDVCLGIFGTSPKALRVVPNKVYQGLAAGAAVVTSDTESQRAVVGETVAFVPPGDADELAKTLRLLAERRELLSDLQRRGRERADADFTPKAVVRPLVLRLRGPVDGPNPSALG